VEQLQLVVTGASIPLLVLEHTHLLPLVLETLKFLSLAVVEQQVLETLLVLEEAAVLFIVDKQQYLLEQLQLPLALVEQALAERVEILHLEHLLH
jgi:hypothetical protein